MHGTKYQYMGHTLLVEEIPGDLASFANAKMRVAVLRYGVMVDWVALPRGPFVTMREAMRIVREEHCGCSVCRAAPPVDGDHICEDCIDRAWDAKCAADGCVA